MKAQALAGRHIVVTRPLAQSAVLIEKIHHAGGIAVSFPTLEILEPTDSAPLFSVLNKLHHFHFAIFISQNAIAKTFEALNQRQLRWPAHLRVCAIGQSSQQALASLGVQDIISPPTQYDSEALLTLPELAATKISGKRFIIFRGEGGREFLGQTLLERGAILEYVASYLRRKPNIDPAPLIHLWQQQQLDAITATSSEGLRNLWDMLDAYGQTKLQRTALFVPHTRIAAEGQRLGIGKRIGKLLEEKAGKIIITAQGDSGLMAGLIHYFSHNN